MNEVNLLDLSEKAYDGSWELAENAQDEHHFKNMSEADRVEFFANIDRAISNLHMSRYHANRYMSNQLRKAEGAAS